MRLNRIKPAEPAAGGSKQIVNRLAGWRYHERSSPVARSSPLDPTSKRRMLVSGGE